MNRRHMLKLLAGATLAGAVPFGFPALAALSPPLPIPPELKPDASGRIRLKLQTGKSLWRTRFTPTWGINGPLLGPTLVLQRGQTARMEVENTLPEDTAIHWHGLEIPGVSDGGPQAIIAPGAVWSPEFTVNQPAATCWYHPHPHGKTGKHVAMGLAGMIILEDDISRKLPLPKRRGLDDIPVVLQDKRLDAEDRIDYVMDEVSAAVGWFGDMLLANGAVYPQHVAPRGLLRLRLLNGCNARTLRLAAGDGRPLYVVASDGGFLPEPVMVGELTILSGERFEVLVHCGDGQAFDLVPLPVRQMGMTLSPFDGPLPVLRIQPSSEAGLDRLPEELVTLPPLPKLEGLPTRSLHLSMDPRLDKKGMDELMRRYGHGAMAGMSMEVMAHGGAEQGQGAGGGGMAGGMEHGASGHAGMAGMAGMKSGPGEHAGMPGMDSGAAGHAGMAGMPGMEHGAAENAPERPFDLWHGNFINKQAFVMNRPTFAVKQGQYERWVISGKGDMMLHPFHIHGAQFRILSENGAPPAAYRTGWKDIVRVEGKDSEVLVRFTHPAPKERAYMAHCHLLEHEDTGMMLAFTVE